MATAASRGTGSTIVTGTWGNNTLAYDGTVGTNPASYATWTNATSGASASLDITGYGFSALVGATDTLNSVTVAVRHFENNTGRFASVTFQAYDGATAIGSPVTMTLATAARTDTATVPATLAQLRSSTFKIRVTPTGVANTQSRTFSLDQVDVTADYTAAAGGPTTTTAQIRSLSLTPVAGAITTGPINVVAQANTLTLTALAGSITTGPVDVVAQVATLTLTPVAITPTVDAPAEQITYPIAAALVNVTSRSSTYTFARPPNVNDIIVVFERAQSGAGLPTDPVDGLWTNLLGANGHIALTGSRFVALYHRVTLAEEAAFKTSWQLLNLWANNFAHSGVGVVLRGVDLTTPLSGVLGTASSDTSVTPFVLADVTPADDDAALVAALMSQASNITQTTPAGWTRLGTIGGSYAYSRDALGESGVSTGTTNVTPSAANPYGSFATAWKVGTPVAPPTTVTAQVATLTLTAQTVTPTLGVEGEARWIGSSRQTISSGVGDIIVTPHADSAIGDLLVWVCYVDGTGGTIDASGWTQILYTGQPDGYIHHRLHDGSASYTITRSVTTVASLAVCHTVRDAVFDAFDSAVGSVTVPVCPTVTPSVLALILASWSNTSSDNGADSPIGFVDIAHFGSASQAGHWARSGTLYPGSPTGTISATANYTGSRTTRRITVACASTEPPVGGPTTTTAQVATLTLTALPITPDTTGAPPTTTAAQIATVTVTALPGTKSVGAVTVTAQLATLTLTALAGTKTVGAVTVAAQVETLTFTALAGTITVGTVTVVAQVKTLTLTALAGTVSAGGAPPTTTTAQVATVTLVPVAAPKTQGAVAVVAQVATLTLTPIAGSKTTAPITVTAQTATLTLTAIAGTKTIGAVTVTAQVVTLTLTPLAGTKTVGAVTVTAQLKTLTLTPLAGSISVVGGSSQTVIAQVATLTITPLAGTKTTGTTTRAAQLATLTLTALPITPSAVGGAPQTRVAQVAIITVTGLAGSRSTGPVTVTAQVATLALTPAAGIPTVGAVAVVAQLAVLTLLATPGVITRQGLGIGAATAIYVGLLPASKVYVGTTQVWPV